MSFHSHPWIQIGVDIWKYSNRSQIIDFSAPVTLKAGRWLWKIIRQVFYATSSFVHHCIAINKFKLELQFGNAQLRLKSLIFRAVSPRKLTDDLEKTIGHLCYATSRFVHHSIAICGFKLELQSRKAEFESKSAIFPIVWPWNLRYDIEQGKSEGFDSCDQPINLYQIGSESLIFSSCMT